jgi:hypothetical protein
MHMLDIPFFKEVIIMAASCDSCGYRTSEVKHGAAISDKGKRITLKVTEPADLSRDILKVLFSSFFFFSSSYSSYYISACFSLRAAPSTSLKLSLIFMLVPLEASSPRLRACCSRCLIR